MTISVVVSESVGVSVILGVGVGVSVDARVVRALVSVSVRELR